MDPHHSRANHNLGALYVQQGQPISGLPFLSAALETDPTQEQYWLSYIDALYVAGQTGTARKMLAFARQHGLGGNDVDELEAGLAGGDAAVSQEPVIEDIVVIDSVFPMKVPYSFRNAEVNGLLKLLPSLRSYTMFPMIAGDQAWFTHGYGIDESTYRDNKAGYLQHHPENERRIEYLHPDRKYRFKLAYMVFLAETYTVLPFLERHRIPFVFELYPGGAFGLDNPSSDAMLRAVFGSRWFRKVITTQKVSYDYLLSRDLCAKENIVHLFGGILQFPKNQQFTKRFYKKDKYTFDICFVAAKYIDKGLDKGYDLFVEAAKRLAGKCGDMRFHVIGGFDENEIDVSVIRDKITFYGFQQPDWLKEFYPRMDICLSPNRPFQKYPGDFDGYPMGCEQSLFGVAMFTTDPLGNDDGLYEKDEIVLFKPELEDITKNVEYYFNNLDELYSLAEKGRRKTGKLFDIDDRLRKIADVLRSAADAV